MTDSLTPPYLEKHQEEENKTTQKRLCDFCSESTALLYCRADSAKLCLSCDLQVHSTNRLFTKHTRSLLCDACDSSPSSIFCCTDTLVLCHNCDWEIHNGRPLCSSVHDRRPVEGFSGCPNVSELLSIVGFDDLGQKALFGYDDGLLGSGDGGFSDCFVWDTPSVVSIDDLIVSNDSGHNFQAMGVPPLPKNRNVTCGQHKEEILRQLREMAKFDPSFKDGKGDIEPVIGFQSLIPDQNFKLGDICAGCEHGAEPTSTPLYEASAFHWCSDSGEVKNRSLPSSLYGSYVDSYCLVPDKDSDICDNSNGCHEEQSCTPVFAETLQVLPKVAARELISQNRDFAISRYKEKKKTRRYEKHVRYQSRRVRAESSTRIKGRFAKIDHGNTCMQG